MQSATGFSCPDQNIVEALASPRDRTHDCADVGIEAGLVGGSAFHHACAALWLSPGSEFSSRQIMRTAVVVFARRPRPGRVKRRLARGVGARQAATIYAELLSRALKTVDARRWTRLLFCADSQDRGWFHSRLRGGKWLVKGQARGDLGRRMAKATEFALRRADAVILIGSDIADLEVNDLTRAAGALDHGTEAVLGPTVDGGYWLVGARETAMVRKLFDNVRWSSEHALADTLANAGTRRVELLDTLDDIDNADDLERWESGRRLTKNAYFS